MSKVEKTLGFSTMPFNAPLVSYPPSTPASDARSSPSIGSGNDQLGRPSRPQMGANVESTDSSDQGTGPRAKSSSESKSKGVACAMAVDEGSDAQQQLVDRDKLAAYMAKLAKESSNPEDERKALMKFMCRCLTPVQRSLPAVGRDAMSTAIAYWFEGKKSEADLEAARVACWQFLDNKGRFVALEDREDAAMRAVINVLFANPVGQTPNHVSPHFFADMLDYLGDCSDFANKMMKV